MSKKYQAMRDAKEFMRAKVYYGEGAGIRRKLIKALVDERSADPVYKKAFEEACKHQDLTKHVFAATTERKVRDGVKIFVKKVPKIAVGVGSAIALYVNNKEKVDKFVQEVKEKCLRSRY